jgi:hypothetical protein
MPDPLVFGYDSTIRKPRAAYVNEVYAWVHRCALGLGMPNARAKMLPARSVSGPDGFHILVLLPRPVVAICSEVGHAIHFQAAILREYGDGSCEGWLISDHPSALNTWAENYPEASAP